MADIVEKAAVDNLESSAAHPYRAAAGVLALVSRVAVTKRQVLKRQPGMVLILAVRSGPFLVFIAGVHVQNARPAAAAERYFPAAVNDNIGVRVVEHLCRTVKRYSRRLITTVKHNDASLRDRIDKGLIGAAFGRACSDYVVRVGDILQAGLGRYRAAALGVARGRSLGGTCERFMPICGPNAGLAASAEPEDAGENSDTDTG